VLIAVKKKRLQNGLIALKGDIALANATAKTVAKAHISLGIKAKKVDKQLGIKDLPLKNIPILLVSEALKTLIGRVV